MQITSTENDCFEFYIDPSSLSRKRIQWRILVLRVGSFGNWDLRD